MARVRLIHWNAGEAEERAQRIQYLGHEVTYEPFGRDVMVSMRKDPPDAVVIDLGRLPSQGRGVAITIRRYKATRHVPLVFAGGDSAKAARIQALLPDGLFTTWDEIEETLGRAISHSVKEPVVPNSIMDSYAGVPLAKKLGIKAGTVVVLDGAPEGFERTLGELPDGVVVDRDVERKRNLTLWFVRSSAELEYRVEEMTALAGNGGLWIVWPKKASGVVSDVSQTVVRKSGLAAGMVDYKVCSVDATWSGLRFTLPKRG